TRWTATRRGWWRGSNATSRPARSCCCTRGRGTAAASRSCGRCWSGWARWGIGPCCPRSCSRGLRPGGDDAPVVEGGVAVEGGELGGETGGGEAGAEGVGVGVALGAGVHPAEQAREGVDAAGGARTRAAVVEAGADDQLCAGDEHRDRGVEDRVLRLGRDELQHVEDRDAAPVRGHAG